MPRVLFALIFVAVLAGGNDDVLLSSDFESEDWYRAWGMEKADSRLEVVAEDPERKFEPFQGKALRVRVAAGDHLGANFLYRFRNMIGEEPEEIYFRYYLRFADDWNPTGGGKMPGISGTYGRAGWGGRPVNGSDGWSARGSFGRWRDGVTPIGYYCYHMDMKGKYGSGWTWDRDRLGYLANNRWYAVEQYVKMNTPGKSDGILRGWIDGRLAFEKTDVRFRDTDSLKIEAVWVNVYHGGTRPAETTNHLYIDNAVISRSYVGPER